VIGAGGMGVVVKAIHLQLEQPVALKLLHLSEKAAPDAIERFLREARATAMLDTEHVVRILDVGELTQTGAPYLVLEYLDGKNLDDHLHERGRLSVAETVEYVLQACEVLALAHARGIVHRDIKPANLFLARRSDGDLRLKVLDFGVAKFVGGTLANQ